MCCVVTAAVSVYLRSTSDAKAAEDQLLFYLYSISSSSIITFLIHNYNGWSEVRVI